MNIINYIIIFVSYIMEIELKKQQNRTLPFQKKVVSENVKTELPVKDTVISNSKKIKKQLRTDLKLVGIQYPKKIENPKFKKRYSIKVDLKDNEGKIHRKTIRFGKKDRAEFIDHKNRELAQKQISHMKNYDSPVKGNYYTLKLLNNKENIQDSYLEMLKSLEN